MSGSRYSQRVDLENWNTSQALAVTSVPPGSRVLDLGAADGSVARALNDRGCTVWASAMNEPRPPRHRSALASSLPISKRRRRSTT